MSLETSTVCFSCNGVGLKLKRLGSFPCNPCSSSGYITRAVTKKKHKSPITRSYPHFVPSGPEPCLKESDVVLNEKEELSFLTGHWRIFQKIGSHRYSTDDLLTSFIACREVRSLGFLEPTKMFDLGCGLGSVLLMNSWHLPEAVCFGMEAQLDRFELAKRSVMYNLGAQQQRVQVFHGDIRDIPTLELGCDFNVVTGTPPYFPKHLTGQPGCSESSRCMHEHLGGVEDYIFSARNLMSSCPTPAIFVICNTALSSNRVYNGCHVTEMCILRRVDVIPLEGKHVLFCIFIITANKWLDQFVVMDQYSTIDRSKLSGFVEMKEIGSGRVVGNVYGEAIEQIIVRQKDASHTDDYCDILSSLGKPSSREREVYRVCKGRSFA